MGLQPVARRTTVLTATEAEDLAGRLFGMVGQARPLPGERDDNFRIIGESGDYILKIAHPAELRIALECQNSAMAMLGRAPLRFQVPAVRTSVEGSEVVTTELRGTRRLVRLLCFVPGVPLAQVNGRDGALWHDIGRAVGEMDNALAGFHHPGARRDLWWDLRHAGTVVRGQLASIPGADDRAIVRHFLERFDDRVAPALVSLRTSVIHNDGNDHNILITRPSRASRAVGGIVDFGDMVQTHTVTELAIVCAYVMLNEGDLLRAAAHVCAGYHQAHPVTDAELDVLFDLICMRLCVSVAVAASRPDEKEANSYLAVTDRTAWDTLRRLVQISPAHARQILRDACA